MTRKKREAKLVRDFMRLADGDPPEFVRRLGDDDPEFRARVRETLRLVLDELPDEKRAALFAAAARAAYH